MRRRSCLCFPQINDIASIKHIKLFEIISFWFTILTWLTVVPSLSQTRDGDFLSCALCSDEGLTSFGGFYTFLDRGRSNGWSKWWQVSKIHWILISVNAGKMIFLSGFLRDTPLSFSCCTHYPQANSPVVHSQLDSNDPEAQSPNHSKLVLFLWWQENLLFMPS